MQKFIELMGARQRGRWIMLVILAALVGIAETVGAFLIFGLLGVVMNPSSGVDLPVIGNVRTRFSAMEDSEFLLWSATIVTGFFILRGGLFLAQSYLQNRVAHNAGVRLSAKLLNGYLNLPYSFHLERNSAELIRNAYTSVIHLVTSAFVPAVILASETLVVLGLFAALLVASPTSTLLVVAVTGPVLLILLRSIRRRTRLLGESYQETSQQSLQTLQESLQSVRDIKILGRASFFVNRFSAVRAQFAKVLYSRGVLMEVPRVATETLLVVLVLLFLVIAIASGDPLNQTLATLGLFGYAGVRLMPALSRLVANVNTLQYASAAVDDVYDQLKLFWDARESRPDVPPMRFERELRVTGLSFAFGEKSVLSGVDFEVRRGESIGIVGATGAGKSTLVDILMALLEPNAGRVTADGVSIHEVPEAWQQNLGVVAQSVVLIDDTLRKNIAFGVDNDDIDHGLLQQALHESQLDAMVAELPEGLDTLVGEGGVRLSGGQRQRVAMARALYRDPHVLILDEATSALDNVTEARLIDALRHLRNDRTLIMVAHRLTTLRHCDSILVLDSGELVDMGTYSELLARNPLFQAVGDPGHS